MQTQLKAIQTEGKGKNASKVASATDELQYLMDFNASITQALAKTMEHLTHTVFVSMGNSTLARRDSYLTHVKAGIKPDTLAALRTAPLQLATLFPDSVLKLATTLQVMRARNIQALHTARVSITLMSVWKGNLTRNPKSSHGRALVVKVRAKEVRADLLAITPDQLRASSPINDKYCVIVLKAGLLAGSRGL